MSSTLAKEQRVYEDEDYWNKFCRAAKQQQEVKGIIFSLPPGLLDRGEGLRVVLVRGH